jgi:hypothetical protein
VHNHISKVQKKKMEIYGMLDIGQGTLWRTFGTFSFVFLWQHIFRVNDIKYKPSYFITKLAIVCETLWNQIGTYLALLSSFYHYVYFYAKELLISLMEITTSVLRFIAAPCYLIYGFLEAAASYVKPHLVWVGGVIVIGSGLGLVLYNFPELDVFLYCFLMGFVWVMIYVNRSVFIEFFNESKAELFKAIERPTSERSTITRPRTRRTRITTDPIENLIRSDDILRRFDE